MIIQAIKMILSCFYLCTISVHLWLKKMVLDEEL